MTYDWDWLLSQYKDHQKIIYLLKYYRDENYTVEHAVLRTMEVLYSRLLEAESELQVQKAMSREFRL